MKVSASKNQHEEDRYPQVINVGGYDYTLKASRKLRPGSNGLLKFVVKNTNGEVIRNYPLLREIAQILDDRHQCQTTISAIVSGNGQKRPVIVIPNHVLTK